MVSGESALSRLSYRTLGRLGTQQTDYEITIWQGETPWAHLPHAVRKTIMSFIQATRRDALGSSPFKEFDDYFKNKDRKICSSSFKKFGPYIIEIIRYEYKLVFIIDIRNNDSYETPPPPWNPSGPGANRARAGPDYTVIFCAFL